MLVQRNQRNNELASMFITGKYHCFHCGKKIERTEQSVIEWHGADNNNDTVSILFHIHCAQGFNLRFARDLYEVLCLNHGPMY